MGSIIPIFKSQYSIGGRSILKCSDIIRLHQKSKQERLFVVDDTLAGFRKLHKKAVENNIPFVFGLRVPTVQSSFEGEMPSKIILAAKNDEGVKALRKIYTKAACSGHGFVLQFDWLVESGFMDDLQLFIPFYDSFIYNNLFHFGVSSLDIKNHNPIFFEEDNEHPYDFLINKRLQEYKPDKVVKVKSIYYENKEDFKVFQMFKAINNRSGGKAPEFDNPNVSSFCSDKFCYESWEEENG